MLLKLYFLQQFFSFLIPSVSIIFAENTTLYYAFYGEGDYYGIWTDISVPFDVPHIEPCSRSDNDCYQFYAVSLPPPHWIQAGWAYHPEYFIPRSYYEYCIVDCESPGNQGNSAFYSLTQTGEHFWGNSINYQVSYDTQEPGNRWCAWINLIRMYCGPVGLTSSYIIAQAEIHNVPQNEMNTLYSDIKVKGADGYWIDPILDNHLHSSFPYTAIKISTDSFKAIGRQWDIHLPIITK
jgi:hypothetical protein